MRYFFSIILFLPLLTSSQSTFRQTQAKEVFDNLVQAYANGKSAPFLEINPIGSTKSFIAQYSSKNGKHFITVDEKLINLCYSFGKDSLSSLAVILSHELAHYYNDHGWCSDYAFAINKTNSALALKLKESSKSAKLEKETLADRYGLFYASVAGYFGFDIFPSLLSKIYRYYKLPDIQAGYPSLPERKKIAFDAAQKAGELYGYFRQGIAAFNENKYQDAIIAFEKANSFIPFRENYNNLGVAKVRLALMLKPITREEVEFPERFLYPLEIENKSRISRDNTRSLNQKEFSEMIRLLKSAQEDFRQAIRMDPQFVKCYINLACVYDLLDNPYAAIGLIRELSQVEQRKQEAQVILAIAFFHNDQEDQANIIWKQIEANR